RAALSRRGAKDSLWRGRTPLHLWRGVARRSQAVARGRDRVSPLAGAAGRQELISNAGACGAPFPGALEAFNTRITEAPRRTRQRPCRLPRAASCVGQSHNARRAARIELPPAPAFARLPRSPAQRRETRIAMRARP